MHRLHRNALHGQHEPNSTRPQHHKTPPTTSQDSSTRQHIQHHKTRLQDNNYSTTRQHHKPTLHKTTPSTPQDNTTALPGYSTALAFDSARVFDAMKSRRTHRGNGGERGSRAAQRVGTFMALITIEMPPFLPILLALSGWFAARHPSVHNPTCG
jgi:hypothetical protein